MNTEQQPFDKSNPDHRATLLWLAHTWQEGIALRNVPAKTYTRLITSATYIERKTIAGLTDTPRITMAAVVLLPLEGPGNSQEQFRYQNPEHIAAMDTWTNALLRQLDVHGHPAWDFVVAGPACSEGQIGLAVDQVALTGRILVTNLFPNLQRQERVESFAGGAIPGEQVGIGPELHHEIPREAGYIPS